MLTRSEVLDEHDASTQEQDAHKSHYIEGMDWVAEQAEVVEDN
jgi:hypothetical protein